MKKKKTEDKIIFKVITLGDVSVGKTSILRRYKDNKFIESYKRTLGIDSFTKEITLNNGHIIYLNFYDTAGQETYRSMYKSYVRNVDGVLLVFDLNKKKTFDNIKTWIEYLDENLKNKNNVVKYLIGNKKDLEKEIDDDDIEIFLEDNKDYIYNTTSAKEEDNQITELFKDMGERLYKSYIKNEKNHKKRRNIKLKSFKEKKTNCLINCFL